MAMAVGRLTGLVDTKDRHNIPRGGLLPAQIEAATCKSYPERRSTDASTVPQLSPGTCFRGSYR